MLIGSRRRNTAVAFKQAEVLMIEKKHLLKIFKATGFDADLRRLSAAALEMFISRERLRSVKAKVSMLLSSPPLSSIDDSPFASFSVRHLLCSSIRLLSSAPQIARTVAHNTGDTELSAALGLQIQWRKYLMAEAFQHDELYKLSSRRAKQHAKRQKGGDRAASREDGGEEGQAGQHAPGSGADGRVALQLEDLQRKQDEMHATLQALVAQLQQPLAKGAQSARSK